MDFAALFASLARQPDDPVALKALMGGLQIQSLGLADYYTTYSAECHSALNAVLRQERGHPREFWNLASAQVCARHGLAGVPPPVDARRVAALAADSLCVLVLSETINRKLNLERFLTRVRTWLLDQLPHDSTPLVAARPLLIALGLQGFNNEFVWALTESEEQAVTALGEALGDALGRGDCGGAELPLLLHSLYRPLAMHSAAGRLAAVPLSQFASDLHPLITRTLQEPRREAELRAALPTIEEVRDPVSRSVRAQYEANPYPRWLALSKAPKTVVACIQRLRPDAAWPASFGGQKMQVLVAGCGTGQHSLQVALGNPDAEVLAVDLSSASLAYAMRMTERHGVRNITFLQGDLLALPKLCRRFHHIECAGVLHHIRDHAAAWKVLADCLHPGGTLRIGVYSKVARLLVSHVRACIQRAGIGTSPAEVRRFRARLLDDPEWASLLPLLVGVNDFFTLSMTRDLLFHVQEHQYTVDEIECLARGLGLELMGFELPKALGERAGMKQAEPTIVKTFEQWRGCERVYVGSMRMFDFWLQKAC